MNARWIFLASIILLLSACATDMGGSFGLTEFTPEIQINQVWSTDVGRGQHGFSPVIVGDRIFALSTDGRVVAFNKTNGRILWQRRISTTFTAGFVEDNGLLFATTLNGDLVALDETDGKMKWQCHAHLNPNAPIAADAGFVIGTLANGNLAAFSTSNGKQQWLYSASITSGPIASNQLAIIGLSNGNVAAVSIKSGHLAWTRSLSQNKKAVDRMATYANQLYASTTSGLFGAYSLPSGQLIFKHKITGAEGLSADASQVYFADNQGFLWAFDTSFGIVSWKQSYFAHYTLSAPASFNNNIIIADDRGYLYWMNKKDGRLVGRNRFDSSGFSAKPIVSDGLLFIYSNGGTLYAYQCSSLAKNVT